MNKEPKLEGFSPLGIHSLYILTNLGPGGFVDDPQYYELTPTDLQAAGHVELPDDPKDDDPTQKWLRELRDDGAMLALNPPIGPSVPRKDSEGADIDAVLCMMINYGAIHDEYEKTIEVAKTAYEWGFDAGEKSPGVVQKD